tara:strand:+ start:851 stop:1234 length:384 start_codon:yes stop_codon:yes gene_type:complete
MSTITVTNIKATGETASRSATSVAAAWNSFVGTGTVALRDSFNTSSITDRGTGAYTTNFSNAMGNANYSHTALSSRSADASQVGLFCGNSTDSSAPTASAAQISEIAGASSFFDIDLINNTFHGDLA